MPQTITWMHYQNNPAGLKEPFFEAFVLPSTLQSVMAEIGLSNLVHAVSENALLDPNYIAPEKWAKLASTAPIDELWLKSSGTPDTSENRFAIIQAAALMAVTAATDPNQPTLPDLKAPTAATQPVAAQPSAQDTSPAKAVTVPSKTLPTESERVRDETFSHGKTASPLVSPEEAALAAVENERRENNPLPRKLKRRSRAYILEHAKELINGERDEIYGDPSENFTRIGTMIAPIVNVERVTPEQVAMIMVVLKLSRLINTPDHEDSWTDIAGYAALGGEIALNKET